METVYRGEPPPISSPGHSACVFSEGDAVVYGGDNVLTIEIEQAIPEATIESGSLPTFVLHEAGESGNGRKVD